MPPSARVQYQVLREPRLNQHLKRFPDLNGDVLRDLELRRGLCVAMDSLEVPDHDVNNRLPVQPAAHGILFPGDPWRGHKKPRPIWPDLPAGGVGPALHEGLLDKQEGLRCGEASGLEQLPAEPKVLFSFLRRKGVGGNCE